MPDAIEVDGRECATFAVDDFGGIGSALEHLPEDAAAETGSWNSIGAVNRPRCRATKEQRQPPDFPSRKPQMLAGMPTHYHVSCRVRNSGHGFDATVTEHADIVIETNGTPVAALMIWLSTDDSWLTASPDAIKSLITTWTNCELEFGWDSQRANGWERNDWETSHICHDEKTHILTMDGTSCCGEFEFELKIQPCSPERLVVPETQAYKDAQYLMGVARFFVRESHVGCYLGDRLREIANRLDEIAVKDYVIFHLNGRDDG